MSNEPSFPTRIRRVQTCPYTKLNQADCTCNQYIADDQTEALVAQENARYAVEVLEEVAKRVASRKDQESWESWAYRVADELDRAIQQESSKLNREPK